MNRRKRRRRQRKRWRFLCYLLFNIPNDIEDDLNSVAAATNYTEVALGTDHEVIFGFDYGGITGPAPNTTDASTTGVLIRANRSLGSSSAATLFHNTLVPANARVTVDMYMGVAGLTKLVQ